MAAVDKLSKLAANIAEKSNSQSVRKEKTTFDLDLGSCRGDDVGPNLKRV